MEGLTEDEEEALAAACDPMKALDPGLKPGPPKLACDWEALVDQRGLEEFLQEFGEKIEACSQLANSCQGTREPRSLHHSRMLAWAQGAQLKAEALKIFRLRPMQGCSTCTGTDSFLPTCSWLRL